MARDKNYRFRTFRISLVLKLALGISASTALVYFLVFRYINYDFENVAIKESKQLAKTIAYNHGCQIQTELNGILVEMRVLGNAFSTYNAIPKSEARIFFDAALQKITFDNPKYTSVWDSWEYRFINPRYTNNFGRIKTAFYRKGNYILNVTDSVNFGGDDINSMYYAIKRVKKEFITEPYFYKLGDSEVLMSSIGVPIILNDDFAGIVGVDIALDEFSRMVDTIKPFPGSVAFLVSDKSTIIAHPNKKLIGKSFLEIDTVNTKLYDIGRKLLAGETIDFEHLSPELKNRLYTVFLPFEVGKTGTTWALAISMPLTSIIEEVHSHMDFTREVAIYGFIVLLLVTLLISFMIVSPLSKTTKILNELALGNIQNIQKLNIRTGDEIQQMSESVNQVIVGLKHTLTFADKIKSGDFEYKFKPLSTSDTLGNSILNMRDSLVKATQEKHRRKEEEYQKNWGSQGLNLFSVLLRHDNDDLHKLSQRIISKLVDYVDVQSGAIYLLEKTSYDEHLELFASCGFPKERINQTEVYENQGPVGRCLIEKQTIYMDDVPSDFSKITSGLGKSNPCSVLITPLIVNEEVLGVIELESLKPIDEYKIAFIETVGVPIASTISMVRINVRTAKLLEESRIQADELAQQEEEMRQNMEEMTATQEESHKREEQYLKFIRSVTSAILYIEYDMDGNITEANERLLQLFQMTRDQVVGKKIGSYEFNSKEKTDQRTAFWARLKAGETIVQEFYAKYLGQEYWLHETYTPINDQNGIPFKVVNIAIDISEEKRKERQIEKLKDKLEKIKKIEGAKKKAEKEQRAPLVDLSEILKNESQFKYIRLSHLFKVYKGDIGKIQNILKIYREAVPHQIEEMRQLLVSQDWESLKARIIGFRTKMTYLGLEELNNLSRQFEKQIALQNAEGKAIETIDKISEIWEEAEKELQTIELT
jgi:PAS domain S-box-containing protein